MAKNIKVVYLHDRSLNPSISEKVVALKNELLKLLEQDEKRDIMHCELREITDGIYEFAEAVENWHDYDPTPQFLYDNDGGGPVVSAVERDSAAFTQKQAMHS